MTTFDEREHAFENKFVRDAELEFLAEAARNKHLAFWAASLMGKSANEAASYAKEVIRADFEQPGGTGVLEKLKKDLGDLANEATIRSRMKEFMQSARDEVIG